MLDDIALFIHIVQKQGLAPTAKALDIPAATVTRRLQRLENTLRCQLIHQMAVCPEIDFTLGCQAKVQGIQPFGGSI